MEIDPTSLPELSKPSRTSENQRKTKMLDLEIFRPEFLTFSFFSFGSGGEIYTVFDEESESEVKTCKILEPRGKD